jgi:predicted RNA-binding Zn-ribbon protein involved in translation (DUF1610 family)
MATPLDIRDSFTQSIGAGSQILSERITSNACPACGKAVHDTGQDVRVTNRWGKLVESYCDQSCYDAAWEDLGSIGAA